jgi:hypothetical protein
MELTVQTTSFSNSEKANSSTVRLQEYLDANPKDAEGEYTTSAAKNNKV